MPKFFLFEVDDVSLLSGNNARWLDFADRLSEANNGIGMAQTIKVRTHSLLLPRVPNFDGSHCFLSFPKPGSFTD